MNAPDGTNPCQKHMICGKQNTADSDTFTTPEMSKNELFIQEMAMRPTLVAICPCFAAWAEARVIQTVFETQGRLWGLDSLLSIHLQPSSSSSSSRFAFELAWRIGKT